MGPAWRRRAWGHGGEGGSQGLCPRGIRACAGWGGCGTAAGARAPPPRQRLRAPGPRCALSRRRGSPAAPTPRQAHCSGLCRPPGDPAVTAARPPPQPTAIRTPPSSSRSNPPTRPPPPSPYLAPPRPPTAAAAATGSAGPGPWCRRHRRRRSLPARHLHLPRRRPRPRVRPRPRPRPLRAWVGVASTEGRARDGGREARTMRGEGGRERGRGAHRGGGAQNRGRTGERGLGVSVTASWEPVGADLGEWKVGRVV